MTFRTSGVECNLQPVSLEELTFCIYSNNIVPLPMHY